MSATSILATSPPNIDTDSVAAASATHRLEKLIPTCLQAPLPVRHVPGCAVLWRSARIGVELGDDDALIERFSYRAAPFEPIKQGVDEELFWVAERYGGRRMDGHAGGARAGVIGGWLVKGIGKTNLCVDDAPDTDMGQVSVVDAVIEAIFGEVFSLATPFGAARAAAVISVGAMPPMSPRALRAGQPPAAMLVRELCPRLGWFQRASPCRVSAYRGLADVARTKAAIRLLPKFLPRSSSISLREWERLHDDERLLLGIDEFMSRAALQVAATKSKRLLHGGLSASNVSLDGRLLDFDRSSLLPDFCPVLNQPPLWTEGVALHQAIADLAFYVNQFYTDTPTTRLKPRELVARFQALSASATLHHMVVASGFPPSIVAMFVQLHGRDLLGDLMGAMQVVLLRGHHAARIGFPDEMASVKGIDLGAALIVLSRWWFDECCDARLANIVTPLWLRARLINTYRVVAPKMQQCAAALGLTRKSFWRLVMLNAARYNRGVPALYRGTLERRVLTIINAHDDHASRFANLTALSTLLIDECNVMLRDRSDFAAPILAVPDRAMIEFDATLSCWRDTDAHRPAMERDVLPLNDSEMLMARDWWGGTAWTLMTAA